MKTITTILRTLLPLCLLLGIYTASAQQFVHPGIPFTRSDLDLLKQNITREPWLSAYNSFKADARSQLSYGMQGPFTTVSRAPDINRNQWINDMTAIHNLAFMWIFTGDTAYAKKATDILNAWAVTQTSWTGDESFLDLGDQANLFVTGADILKSTYPGWTATNTVNVNRYFGTVIWSQLDVPNPVRGLNQGAIQLKAAVSIAAFLDDPVKWSQAIQSYRADAGGGLANSLPNGQVGDAGRDEGHWRGQGEALAWSAEVAWKQGIDLFTDLDNRLLAISELYSHFHQDTTGFRFIPFGGTYGFFTGWGSNGTAKQLFRMYNIIEGAYTVRKGIPAPWSVAMRDRLGENAATFLYRKSADSSTAVAPAPLQHPVATAVANLTNADVGATGLAGSAVYSNGKWTVKGAGADIPVPVLQSKDAFNFAFQKLSGNVTIVARITSMDDTDVAAKAGIMFRESLNDDAAFTGLFMQPNNRIASTWRNAVAWSKTNISWNNPPRGYLEHYVAGRPYWLKMEKIGSRITAYHSFDSISWTCLSAVEIPMTEPLYVGLCVSSHNTSVLNTAVFDGVSITNPSPAGSPVISSATADTAVLGAAYSYAIAASPQATLFSADGLPAGLAIDSTTGLISGTPDTTGTFAVTLNAVNASGTGTAQLMLRVVNNVAPAPPAAPALSKETDSTIRISWAAADGATSYTVKHALTAGGPYTTIVSGVTGTSYLDATAFPGHNYYVVTAFAGTLESVASAEVSLQLPATIPATPLVTNGNNQVSLSWASAKGADVYNVKRAVVRGGPYTTVASGVTDTSYTDATVTNGSYYYYVVSSFTTPLESANSGEVLAVPGASSGNWSATATTGNWSNGTNWTGGNVPASPALLNFDTSSTDTLNNDIDGLEVARFLFNPGADAFVISGDSIQLGNDIINNSTKAQVINLPMQINRTVAVNAVSADISLNGPISGSGGITKSGRASLNIAGANTFTGDLIVNGVNAGGWPPNTIVALTGVGTGAIGAPLSGPAGTGKIIMNGGALMNNNNTAILYNDLIVKDSVKSYLYSNAGGLTFAGRILGSGIIEHDGASTGGLHLNGDNREFTGTFISVNRSSNHRIRFNVPAAGSAKARWIFNNGFTDGQGFTFTDTIRFGSMEGGGQLRRDNGAPVISIGALNTNTTFFGIITGALTIMKEGTGILRFTGANNYNGNTTVTGGTLLIDSTGQITSATTVVAGAIGGIGTCTGPVTVGTGAMLVPGSQGIGKFTTGLLTLKQDAVYLAELNTASGAGDQVSASGVVLNNPRLTITAIGAASIPEGTSYTIVNNTGTAAVTGIFDSLPEMSLVVVNGLNFRITYKGGTGNDIVLLDDRTLPSVVTSPDSASVIIGKPFTYTITAIKSPNAFHATNLPAGLSIDTVTGIISGTPTVSGIFPVQLSATGATGTGTSTLTLTVYSNIVGGLIVASGDKKDILEWKAIQNLRYLVKRATDPAGPFTSLDTVAITRYTDTAVVNGSIYYYAVAAVDGNTVNPLSDPVTATPNIGQHGYWKFDEQSGARARDVWGANHGTLAATAQRDTGYAATALKLDGTANAYASLPAGVLSSLNDFSITLWVKMDAIANWMRIFDFGNGTNNYLFLTAQAGVTSGKSIVRYAIKNGGGEQQLSYNYTFPLSTWTHFAITQSGNTCRMYINGALVATNTGVSIKPAALGSTAQNYLGKSQFAADPNLKGRVDECRIYNRALSAAEIAGAMKAMQEITFTAIPGKRIGDADFSLTATSSSGLPLTFSSSDEAVARVINSVVSILQPGSDTITVTQAGDSIYAPATAKQVLNVLPFNLQVQHMDGDTQTAGTAIKPYLKLVNNDTLPAAYKELTARYWFTAENYAGINTWIDYAALGSKVKMKYVALDTPRSGAFGFVEYSFDSTAGALAAGANSGAIQSRIANKNWASLQETDDYSYAATQAYTANAHITLYRNGKLVWGAEPAVVAPLANLKVATQANATAQNIISTYLRISNEGNMPVNYEDLSVRYWFTTEDALAVLNYWIDYAALGKQYVSGAFVRVSPALDGADAYFEVKLNAATGTLYPLSNSGNIQYRIAKANWSNFNQTNDYSYQPGTLSINPRATLYYKGTLIWGTEPGAAGSASRQALAVAKATPSQTTGLTLFPNPVVNELRVKMQDPVKDAWISVMSNSGVVVRAQRITATLHTLSFEGLTAGVYYVTIRNNGRETTRIIIKQ